MKMSQCYTVRFSARSRLMLVCSLIYAAPLSAQQSEIPPPPDLPPNAKVGPGDLQGEFNDPGNSTAKSMAQAEGISVGEATSRLKQATNAARNVHRLQERFPDRFAGAVVELVSGKPRVVVFHTGSDPLDSSLVDPSANGSIEQREAKLSNGQIKKLGKDLSDGLGKLGVVADVAVSAPLNKIRVLARDPAAVQQAIDAGKITLPDIASVEQFSGIVTTIGNIGAGYAANTTAVGCTIGFTVTRTTVAERGTTTAGHCDNSLKVSDNYSSTYSSSGQASTTYKQQWIVPTSLDYGIDLQWHTVSSSTNTPIPQFWNGTSWVGVTGGKDDLAGEYVCKFGRTTSQTCGYIDPYEYYDSTFKGYFPRVNRGSGPQLNIEGDSGGAVYQGSLAVGFVHGRDSTYNMYYTPLRNLVQNSVGIAILTIYP